MKVSLTPFKLSITAKNIAKLDEHEKMLESLENQKKAQVKMKQFKEAKKTKDLIDMKTKTTKEIEMLKQLIADNEQRLESAKKKLSKQEAKKVEIEKELRGLEITVVNLLLNESEHFSKEIDLYGAHVLYRSTVTDPSLYVTAESNPTDSMCAVSISESEQNELGKLSIFTIM
jgi:chromosome segregation ATPase